MYVFVGQVLIISFSNENMQTLELRKKSGANKYFYVNVIAGKSDPELATQVLQFVFLSDCGFRFPIAQFPSGSCTPSDLYFLFWEGVLKMLEEGFT